MTVVACDIGSGNRLRSNRDHLALDRIVLQPVRRAQALIVFVTMSKTILCGRVAMAALVGAGISFAGAGPALADEPVAVPQAMLDTHCTLDQLMAATKVVEPIVYDAIVTKYSQETPWIQQHAIYHMNLFLQKDPADRQAEVDELGSFFPEYAALFRTQDAAASQVAAQCGSMPAQDPSVWVPGAAAQPAPATAG
ncbi:DUF5078 domain-containing protein [Mycolicibacterium sp. A43C]